MALLTAVTMLGWLWGPAGLLLATPLTVCLVVLGRHLPELKAVGLLVGDAPVLPPPVRYYQRLLAGDPDEAAEVVEAFQTTHSTERLLDALVLPALFALKRDRLRGAVSAEDQARVLRATRRIVGELAGPPASRATAERSATVLGVAMDDPIDELALELLAATCGDDACQFTTLSSTLLSSEVVAAAERQRPSVVCIGAVPPGGLAETRHVVKRLRARLPGVLVLAGRWGGEGYVEEDIAALLAAGVHDVGTTLAQSRRQLSPLLQLRTPDAPVPPPTHLA